MIAYSLLLVYIHRWGILLSLQYISHLYNNCIVFVIAYNCKYIAPALILMHCSICLTTGDSYVIKTSTDYDYSMVNIDTTTNYLMFRLKACSDGHIGLSAASNIPPDQTYEIVLSGYSNSL